MRLSPQEILAIKSSVLALDPKATVYLYGSRLDDSLKGGDIDLLVETEKLGFSDKLSLLISIKDKIGEQKIDLSIRRAKEIEEDPFFQSVKRISL